MEYMVLYIALAAAFGLFMAWGIGANDVANAMATSVGSRAVTIKQAVLIAAVFEFAGAVLAGGGVTSTIRRGMIDTGLLVDKAELLVFGMLAALLAAGTWLLIASWRGWPVSTTHSIIGAIVGFGAVGLGIEAVKWGTVGVIAMSWVVSPLLGGAIAYAVFVTVQKLILERDDPLTQARRWVPFYIFLTGFTITLITLTKAIEHIGVMLGPVLSVLVSAGVGITIALIGMYFIRRIKIDPEAERAFHFHTVERVFGVLMIVSACAMAFAHGSNDVANAVGPVAAVVSVATSGQVDQEAVVSIWILMIGAIGIVIGLATYGFKVIRTVGRQITRLTPSRGFAANLGAATTIVLASGTGLPISTTHTLVGAVLGVGLARGIAAINLRVVRGIFASWLITVPAGAILAIIFFLIIRAVLG
jgi:PiT family inorganic phosphate transporter